MPTQAQTQAKFSIPQDIRTKIAQLLGREPRGLESVALCGPTGEPMVIRVASLVDGAPFPNLFWLIDPALVYRIDCDEAGGLIQRLQEQVDGDSALQHSMISDHRAHIALRNSYMTKAIEAQLRSDKYYEVLQQRGIGGIADFGRIRCLHTWYAAHLVAPNTIGGLLDQHWAVVDEARGE
jgi:hypothetical protein